MDKTNLASVEPHVAAHYAHGDLEGEILKALAASGKDISQLVPVDLAPVDEFHTAGRLATIDLAAQLHFAPGMHLLDIGCGIGGASRFFAQERGCRVTGIDLTDDYVRAAAAFSRRFGLDGQLAYRQASALALPFEAGAFDGAYMLHVGMNIADKPRLFTEARRVLKPGAEFALFDVMRTDWSELRYPVPWAATSATSFVASPADYRKVLEAAGFEVLGERGRREFARNFFREMAAKNASNGGPPPLGIHILMKTEGQQKIANYVANLDAGLIAPVEMICRAR
ncbi:MAG: class I SAM-dependent methyltransferase [Bradyrhizobiaceae bacterium]|nr:class I SAM-dependent methyltransferase [Bradyrhizobiaceae bacterium]